jgi:hypothetical protein
MNELLAGSTYHDTSDILFSKSCYGNKMKQDIKDMEEGKISLENCNPSAVL